VVLSEDARDTVSQADISGFLRETFPAWQLPDDILFVEEIPKTSVGKFSKKAIRERYRNHYRQGE
jgi:fatty-acyl-CoA synthase